jgi:hypothetical protein
MKEPEPWVSLVLLFAWVGGVAVAKGFVMTVLSLFPPVAWVLLAQYLLERI